MTQWVPLYESNEATVKSEIATFFEVFPNGTIWGNDQRGQGYDVVLLGQVEPLHIDIDSIEARLARPDMAPVDAVAAARSGFPSVVDLLGTYAGQASDLESWLADAQINRDRNLRLQYLAGMTPDWYKGGPDLHRHPRRAALSLGPHHRAAGGAGRTLGGDGQRAVAALVDRRRGYPPAGGGTSGADPRRMSSRSSVHPSTW